MSAIQVFSHPKLGVVIYDPVAQMGLTGEQMRLFKLGTMGASTFMRSIVSKDLTTCEDSTNTEQVQLYRTARTGRRKPY